MQFRTLIASFLASFSLATSISAEPKTITAVARVLPAPSGIELPVLPEVNVEAFTKASITEPTRTHRSASLDSHYDISAFGLPCGANVSATLVRDTEYAIRISAPCRPHDGVALAISGLRFDVTLSLTGNAQFNLPILSNSAVLETVFSDHETHVTSLPEADVADSTRVAISWAGETGAELVARGHDVITIGNGPHRLQVLSINHMPGTRETIRLAIHRNVTSDSCDTPASAQFFQQTGAAHPTRYDLTFAPAGCARIGETLELKNILEDLKLALN